MCQEQQGNNWTGPIKLPSAVCLDRWAMDETGERGGASSSVHTAALRLTSCLIKTLRHNFLFSSLKSLRWKSPNWTATTWRSPPTAATTLMTASPSATGRMKTSPSTSLRLSSSNQRMKSRSQKAVSSVSTLAWKHWWVQVVSFRCLWVNWADVCPLHTFQTKLSALRHGSGDHLFVMPQRATIPFPATWHRTAQRWLRSSFHFSRKLRVSVLFFVLFFSGIADCKQMVKYTII